MTSLPLSAIGTQARFWSRQCKDEKSAMLLNYVAVGCMIFMAGSVLLHFLKDENREKRWDR